MMSARAADTPTVGPPASDEEALFFGCIDLDTKAREARLAQADPALAARVRRLLALDAAAERSELDLPQAMTRGPREIGPYRVLELLGEGGMGQVWLAVQPPPLRRLLALKLLRPGMVDAQALARFELERQTLALMQHHGIARILDAGQGADGRPWFAMEYVRGPSIVTYCEQLGLDLRSRLKLFLKVCGAVQHAHQKGVIHRDLKPSNILVTDIDAEAQPVIIDFGVAKALGAGPQLATLATGIGVLMGTPDYISPEQAGLGASGADTRSDVWSLGAVLYELLAGSPPFRFAARQLPLLEVQRELRSAQAQPPSQRARALEPAAARSRGHADTASLARALAGELDWIVLRALERERSRRYRSADALAADIERHLAGEAVQAHPPSLGYQLRKLARRHALVSTGIAAIGLALLAIVLLMAQNAAALRAERDRTLQAARRAAEVTGFVTGLFDSADPRRGPGGELSARELLDGALTRIQRAPSDDPALQGALLAAAARLYLGLGKLQQAESLARQALQLRQAGSPGRAESAAILGEILAAAGQLPEAEQWQREALQRFPLEAGTPATHPASVALALADNLQRQGRHAEALPQVDAARAMLAAAGLRDSARDASALVIGARIQRASGALQDARQSLERALLLMRAEPGSSRERLSSAQSSLGLVLLDLGQGQEAQAVFGSLVDELVEHYGEQHPDTLVARNNLGLAMIQAGQAVEAERLLRDAAREMRVQRGERHPSTLALDVNHAVALAGSGQPEAAEALLRTSRPGLAAVHGQAHFSLAMLDHHLAGSLQVQGRLEEAAVAAEAARRQLAATLGEANHRWLLASLRLAEIRAAQGDAAAARSIASETLARADGVWPASHPDRARLGALAGAAADR